MLALPIFPCSHPQSIFSADELNFCVRNGNRWTLAAINTNYISVCKVSPTNILYPTKFLPLCQALIWYPASPVPQQKLTFIAKKKGGCRAQLFAPPLAKHFKLLFDW